MKLNKKTLFINGLIVLCILFHITLCKNFDNSKLNAFPNRNEPPTSPEYLVSANFTAPLMSSSLREAISQRRLRKSDFLSIFKYGSYELTRGESEQIFNFVDQNKDDLIDKSEWGAFVGLFILPFQACDKKQTYLLEVPEFTICFDKDPKTKSITFTRKQEKEKYTLIMDIISTRGKSVINFADYVFLRRALFGWRNCHSSNQFIAMSQFKCAFRESLPQKYLHNHYYENIYKVGLKFANDRNLLQLDFISYLRTLNFAYVFSIISLPNDTPVVEKTQFIKAIREDRIPMNINEDEVNIWFNLIKSNPFKTTQEMNFQTFAFFYNYHRIFYKYNMEKPLQISKYEVLMSMNDTYFPEEVTQALDVSNTNFTEDQYLHVSNILKRIKLNERDFYYRSFLELKTNEEENLSKQDASMFSASYNNATTIKRRYWDDNKNMENRKVFFDIMTGMDKNFWTQEIWYRTAVLTNFFDVIHGIDDKFWLIGTTTFIDEIPHKWDIAQPVVGLELRKNFNFYKILPRELQIDILDFLVIENFYHKVNIHKNDNNKQINESLMKIILKDCGMGNMPDTILDLSAKERDVLGRRVYDYRETLVNVITVHAAAGDDIRSNGRIKDYKLKENHDPSRQFTEKPATRLAISPMV